MVEAEQFCGSFFLLPSFLMGKINREMCDSWSIARILLPDCSKIFNLIQESLAIEPSLWWAGAFPLTSPSCSRTSSIA